MNTPEKMGAWNKDIRDRRQVVEYVKYILTNKDEICTQEALDMIKKSGKLKFNLTSLKKLGRILGDSHQFNREYKYSKYCKEKATHWSRKRGGNNIGRS